MSKSNNEEARLPALGELVVLSLEPDGPRLPVRITSRTISAARETRLEKLIHTPSVWGSALASLAVFVLVSTAFATGTVRPAPPQVPTPRPGEPTPTPDTRPAISIGGFVLQPPAQPTPVPPTPAVANAQEPAQSTLLFETPTPEPEAPAVSVQPTPQPCTNLFGIGCGSAPPLPPRRLPPPPLPTGQTAPPVQPGDGDRQDAQSPSVTNQQGSQPVLPVASPAARPDEQLAGLQAANPAPARGSTLETALQAASVADENFARELDSGLRIATSADATLPDSSTSGSGK